ncbi:MAG: carbohydrate-binding family 9-like protein, partial [Candidatus Omnitrophica bacterium]|nr:carbohydrate-binding family 9-like protein [Candidatus Omnitrophota bacterium]
MILFGFVKASNLYWEEKGDHYILNNNLIELKVSKQRPGSIIGIKVKNFETENFFSNYFSFSPKEKEYLSPWKYLNKTKTQIYIENNFLFFKVIQDWDFLELIEQIRIEEGKDYFYLSFTFIPKTKYYVKRMTIPIVSPLKYRVLRSIYGPFKKIENTRDGKWYTYGYDIWKENRFAENRWFAFENENGEGVCFVFPEIGNWNTFIGKWKYIWGRDNPEGTFTIEFDNPIMYEREIEDEKVIMDMYIGFYKGNPEQYATILLNKLEKKKEEKVLPVVKTNEEMKFDGDLKETSWRKGFFYKNFINTKELKKTTQDTEIVYLYDEKGIYFGFICNEERIKELKMKKTLRDSEVWEDDDIELFFDPGGKYYYQIAINPAGTIFDARIDRETKKYDKNWNPEIKLRTKIGEEYWSGEIFIPWKDLGINYKEIEVGKVLLKGDIGRDRKEKFESIGEISNIFYSSEKRWHEIKDYGILKLIEVEKIPSLFIKNQKDILYLLDRKILIELKGGENKFYKVFCEFVDEEGKKVFSGNRIIKGGKNRELEIPFEINIGNVDKFIFGLMDEDDNLIFSNVLPVSSPKKQILNAQLLKQDHLFNIYYLSPNIKVKPDDAFVVKSISSEIKIYLAKNEYEPFQIIIRPKEKIKIENINIKISDLIGKNGIIEKKNINWREVGYIDIKTPSGVKNAYPGRWPDPLFPKDKFSIDELRNYPLWFTVYVPVNTKEGEYKGEIEIFEGAKSIGKFSLTVFVWNFNLPDISTLCVIANCDFYGKLKDNMDVYKFLENFKRHKISSTHRIPGNLSIEEYFSKFNFKNFMVITFPANQTTQNPGQLTFRGKTVDVEDKEFIEFTKSEIKKEVEKLKEKNLLDKGYVYLWDEPAWNKSEWVRKTLTSLAKIIREV